MEKPEPSKIRIKKFEFFKDPQIIFLCCIIAVLIVAPACLIFIKAIKGPPTRELSTEDRVEILERKVNRLEEKYKGEISEDRE